VEFERSCFLIGVKLCEVEIRWSSACLDITGSGVFLFR